MKIFEYQSYRPFLTDYIAALPHKGRGQLQKLAKFLNVHPTLISQVLGGQKNFSEEQAFKVCEYLNLTVLERDYFMNLVHLERAGNPSLQEYYLDKLEGYRLKANQVSSRIKQSERLADAEAAIFYSDWKYSAIRLMCSIPGFNRPEIMSRKLNLDILEVKRILDFLVENELVTRTDENYNLGTVRTHIPPNSPFVKSHHTNWRLKSIEKASSISSGELQFTAPLTISEKDFQVVRSKILDLIEEVGKTVADSPSEQLACLTVDFIKVLRS